MGFTHLDYAVVLLYLVATALLGVLIGRGQKSVSDYFLAGRTVPWWVVCFSIVATETSTLTFIGAPALSYAGNLTFVQVVLGYVVGRILVSALLLPGYFRGRIQTAYQVLLSRFGNRVRSFSAALFLVTRSLADGVRLFSTGLVLSVVTGIPDTWAVLLIGIVTAIYTFYGGFVAVVWNDVIQFGIYLAGAAIAFQILLSKLPQGWSGFLLWAETSGKLQVFDLSFSLDSPYTFWSGLIGGTFLTLATHGTDQMMVQRYLASGSLRRSQVALVASGLVVLVQFTLFLVIGVMLYRFYELFPPETALLQTDRVFPMFIVQQMPPGISGLIIAAIFAAAMSTLSSSLNSLASSSMHDLYGPFRQRNNSIASQPDPNSVRERDLKVSRFLTLAWCGVLMAVSLLARNWGSVLEVGLTITSITMGSVLGVFALGSLSNRVAQTDGLIGMISGLLVMVAVHTDGALAWPWYVLVGSTVTLAIGILSAAVRRGAERTGT